MSNQTTKTNSFREALAKAETTLKRLRTGSGDGDAQRLRSLHTQEKVVRAYRRLVNQSEKSEAFQINGNH